MNRRVRVAAALLVAVALGFALVELPSTVRRLEDRSDANAALPRSERLLQAAYSLDFSRDFVHEAAALLPLDARYLVEVGPNAGNTSGTALNAIPALHTGPGAQKARIATPSRIAITSPSR